MVSNDSLYSKHGIDSLTKSLACSEAGLLLGVIQNLICPRTKNTHFLERVQFVAQGLAQYECWILNLHQNLDQKMASDVRGIHFFKKKFLAIELHISDILPPEYRVMCIGVTEMQKGTSGTSAASVKNSQLV